MVDGLGQARVGDPCGPKVDRPLHAVESTSQPAAFAIQNFESLGSHLAIAQNEGDMRWPRGGTDGVVDCSVPHGCATTFKSRTCFVGGVRRISWCMDCCEVDGIPDFSRKAQKPEVVTGFHGNRSDTVELRQLSVCESDEKCNENPSILK